jgi:transposase
MSKGVNKNWTKKEDAELRRLWGHVPIADLMKKLSRPARSIRRRASRLLLKATDVRRSGSIRCVAKRLCVSPNTIRKAISELNLKIALDIRLSWESKGKPGRNVNFRAMISEQQEEMLVDWVNQNQRIRHRTSKAEQRINNPFETPPKLRNAK